MLMLRKALMGSVLVALGLGAAQAGEPLRICAAEAELPYSDQEGRGFENRLAEILAQELHRTVENVWWRDPRYFVRDQLDRGLCDVVMGVDQGDPRVLTSEPYYRSSYVFIYPKSGSLKVTDWDSPYLRQAKQIAFMPYSPPETMLKKIGRYNDQFNYLQSLVGFKARRNQYVRYDPEKLVNEVASGQADLAILWGPQAARYVKASGKLDMQVIPDHQTREDGQKVAFHYSTSIGVRKDDQALVTEINRALKNRAKEIQAVLKEEGIPLIKEGAVKTEARNKKH